MEINAQVLKALINISCELYDLDFPEREYVIKSIIEQYGININEVLSQREIVKNFGKCYRENMTKKDREQIIQTLTNFKNSIDGDGSLDW